MSRIRATVGILAVVALILGALVVPATASHTPAEHLPEGHVTSYNVADDALRLRDVTPWMKSQIRHRQHCQGDTGDPVTLVFDDADGTLVSADGTNAGGGNGDGTAAGDPITVEACIPASDN